MTITIILGLLRHFAWHTYWPLSAFIGCCTWHEEVRYWRVKGSAVTETGYYKRSSADRSSTTYKVTCSYLIRQHWLGWEFQFHCLLRYLEVKQQHIFIFLCRFILTEMKPEPVEVKQLLKTLIRIARHSFELANDVFMYPGLLDAVRALRMFIVISFFLLLNILIKLKLFMQSYFFFVKVDVRDSSSYYPEALKLFRIIASRSKSLASALYNKYDIQRPIFKFIAG